MLTIGEKLKEARSDKKWSLSTLSEKTGLARSTLCDIEHERLIPSVKTLIKLAEAFEKPSTYFMPETIPFKKVRTESEVTANQNRTTNRDRQSVQLPAVPRRGGTGVRAAKGRKAPAGGKA